MVLAVITGKVLMRTKSNHKSGYRLLMRQRRAIGSPDKRQARREIVNGKNPIKYGLKGKRP